MGEPPTSRSSCSAEHVGRTCSAGQRRNHERYPRAKMCSSRRGEPSTPRYVSVTSAAAAIRSIHRTIVPLTHPGHSLLHSRLNDLDQFISEKTGIPHDAIWAYLSDGRPLRNDNIRDLAGVEDQVRSVSLRLLAPTDMVTDNLCVQQGIPQHGH